MKVDIAPKVCSTCPWRKENAHQLEKETIKHMVQSEIISPCHQKMAAVTGNTNVGVEVYAEVMREEDNAFEVCRGMQIARAKQKRKHKNFMLEMLDAKMRLEDDYDRDDLVDMKYIYGETDES